MAKKGRPIDLDRVDTKCEEILSVARGVFAKHGYDNTNVGEIATLVGCSKGSIYYYFENKEVLFLTCVDRMMQEMLTFVKNSADTSKDEFENMEAAIEAYLVFFDKHPNFIELLIQERAIFKNREKPTYFKHREQNLTQWKAYYQQLMGLGRIRQMSVDKILDCVGDLLYGAVFINYFSGRKKSMKQHAQDLMEVVWYGILSENEKKSRQKQGENK